MNTILKGGLLIGLLSGAWSIVVGAAGWHTDPVLNYLFFVVILIQIGVLVWGLPLAGKEGKGYWAQVGRGTLMSLVAGVILFAVSYLLTTLIFPNYFEEIRQAGEQAMRAQQIPEADIGQAGGLCGVSDTVQPGDQRDIGGHPSRGSQLRFSSPSSRGKRPLRSPHHDHRRPGRPHAEPGRSGLGAPPGPGHLSHLRPNGER